MRPFTYQVPSSIQKAISDFGQDAEFVAGGTTLIDLMKLEVMTPTKLVDINRLPMRGIEVTSDGLRIGTLEKMSDVAEHPEVIAKYPVISQALLKSASAQLRNMASMGGISCNGLDVDIFGMSVHHVINVNQEAVVLPSTAGTGRTRFSVQAHLAPQRIQAI